MTKPALLRDELLEDAIGRGPVQRTLVDAISRLKPPSCIALYGPWGAGKSTLLQCTEAWWRAQRPTVFFDPWEHERHGDVLSGLLFALVEEIRGRRGFEKQETLDLVLGLARSLADVSLRIGLHVGARTLLGLDKDDLDALKDLKPSDTLAAWTKYQSAATRIQKDFAALVTQLAPPFGAPLVVFIDDLDRCLPDNVVVVLEAMKLLLCGNRRGETGANVVFVCALDRQIVGEAVAQRYPSSSRYSGETYLEKLFDLSLEVPPVGVDEARRFIQKQWADAMGDTVAGLFAPVGGLELVGRILAQPVFANPRVIKRVLNRLVLLLDRKEAREQIEGWAIKDRERFVAWVAGAERFRSFRTAFMEATPSELRALSDRQSGRADMDLRRLGPALQRSSETPGFNQYYEALKLKGELAEGLLAQQSAGSTGAPTLLAFDMLMRATGL